MEVVAKIIFILQLLFIIYISISAIYYLLFAVAGLYAQDYAPPIKHKKKDFCILIPGYQEDIVIVNVAADALKQAYPKEKYDVYVIADTFKEETIQDLKNIPVHVIEVKFRISTKARAINKALETIEKNYDAVVILDADNLMDPNFLKKMNNALHSGAVAIQAHRMAKNLDTTFSVLDGISEEVNNHIFRRGHRALGLSSALIGSGMVFDFHLYKRLMNGVDSHAEDKDLEIKLFSENYKIEFYDQTYVLDEKVSKSDVFVKQRSRWLANQFLYARRYFFRAIAELFRGNIDFFDKIFQYMLPPRIILLGTVYIILLLSILFNPLYYTIAWSAIFIMVNVAIAISVPKRFYNRTTLRHLLSLPQGFLLMLVSAMRFKEAVKAFNPTPKTGSSDFNQKKKKA